MTPDDDVDADDVLDALRRQLVVGPHPVSSAPEIAEHLPIGRRTTFGYLEKLEFAGEVASVKIGSGRAWYIPDVIETVPPAEPPEEPPSERRNDKTTSAVLESQGGEPDWPSPSAEVETEPPAEPASEPLAESDELAEAIEDLHIPGSGQQPEQRREALWAVLEYLDENGVTEAGELQDALYEHHPAGYKNARSWWKNYVSVKLGELEEQGHVELVNKSRGRWRTV